MELWRMSGGKTLYGSCSVQGSKNASLPILAAALVCPAKTELSNVPRLRDVDAALRILRHLGCTASQQQNDVYIDSGCISCSSIPDHLMEEMRSSVIFLGALVARCGEARFSLPGGCQLGKRPIDLHLDALRRMGAEISEEDGEIVCRAEELRGTVIDLRFPSVGATENIMLAACRAKGTTVILGAAREPEIVALQDYLLALGAEVSGAGSSVITIEGFHPKKAVAFRILPDRIVASTVCCAAAAAGGAVELRGVVPEHFFTVLSFLKRSGCDIIVNKASVVLRSDGKLRSPGMVVTEPYPGFPTDAQPVLMAALLKAEGRTTIEENIFENRFRPVPELKRLGADIVIDGRRAVIRGVERLSGNTLHATDLRGGAAMIVAGLSAEGESVLYDEGHITRGYESFDRLLRSLGAEIRMQN